MGEIIINGDYMEGGGQILRTSLSISSIIKHPIKIEKIRNNRKVPGLQNQHLTGVLLLSEICNAKCSGDILKSTVLHFKSTEIKSGVYSADCKTAGSVCLVIQSIVPTLIYAEDPSNVTIKGGTDADFAPPIDFFQEIVLFYLAKFSIQININLIKRGFYPKGGGEVNIDIYPIQDSLPAISLTERGTIVKIEANCFVAGTLPINMVNEMENYLKKHLKPITKGIEVSFNSYKESNSKSFGNGSGILLVVHTSNQCKLGFSVVGKREYSPEQMAQMIIDQYYNQCVQSESCVDQQMQDQILIYMAMANGKSTIRSSELTLHSKTGIYILQQLLNVKFEITPIQSSNDMYISCIGANISKQSL